MTVAYNTLDSKANDNIHQCFSIYIKYILYDTLLQGRESTDGLVITTIKHE